ncbi:hypothetical protein H5410_036839, partial [Solanum commersonii]
MVRSTLSYWELCYRANNSHVLKMQVAQSESSLYSAQDVKRKTKIVWTCVEEKGRYYSEVVRKAGYS